MNHQLFLLRKDHMLSTVVECLGSYSVYDYDVYNKTEILLYVLDNGEIAVLELVNNKLKKAYIKSKNNKFYYLIN